MIISKWVIYLVGICTGLRVFLLAAPIAYALFVLLSELETERDYSDAEEVRERNKKRIKRVFLVFLSFLFLLTLIPSQESIYLMLLVDTVSFENLNIAKEVLFSTLQEIRAILKN